MKLKSFFTGFLGALVAALAMAGAMAQTPADVLKPGTVFHLESVNKLTGAKDHFTVRIDTVGAQVHGTRTDAGKPPRPIMDILRDVPAPLTVGQTWTHKPPAFQREWRGTWSNYQYDGKALVTSEETLSVAGQSVKVQRIVYSGKVNRVGIGGAGARSWEYEQVRWYAPDIGYVLQYVANETENGEKLWDYASKVVKIDLPAAANPAAAPAPAAPVATTAAATAVPPKQ